MRRAPGRKSWCGGAEAGVSSELQAQRGALRSCCAERSARECRGEAKAGPADLAGPCPGSGRGLEFILIAGACP